MTSEPGKFKKQNPVGSHVTRKIVIVNICPLYLFPSFSVIGYYAIHNLPLISYRFIDDTG